MAGGDQAGLAVIPSVDGQGGGGGLSPEESSRLFQATVDRKRADQDALLLANRIALLRLEEQKASRKIAQTHKRTREIVDLRRRNEDARNRREEQLFMQEKALDDRRDLLFQQREAQQRKLQGALGGAQAKKFALRDEIRGEKRELQHRAHTQMEDEYAKAASKRDRIRTAAMALQVRRHQTLTDKQTTASARLELKIATEHQRKTDRDDNILRMEREEVELIQRLQQTQQRQRAAYDQLEEVLQHPQQTKVGPESMAATASSSKGFRMNSSGSKFGEKKSNNHSGLEGKVVVAPPPQAAPKQAPAPGRKQAVAPRAAAALQENDEAVEEEEEEREGSAE